MSSRSWKLPTRQIGAVCAVGLMTMAVPVAAGASSPDVQALDELALENNESIHAFDSRVRQSEQQARFEETRFPQPMFEYMGDISAPWSSHFETGHMVRLMQEIPRGGARDRQAEPARAQAEATRFEQRTATVELLRDVRLDIIELARIDAQLELLGDEIGLIDDAIRVMEATAPLDGMADFGDFYQLELARETAVDRRAQLESMRQARRAQLAARMGVQNEQLEGVEFDDALLEQWMIELPERDELMEMARQGDPRVGQLQAQGRVADARINLVDERLRPAPRLMAGYSNMPPMWEMDGPRDQMFQVGISFELPVFRSQYGAEASQWQQARQAVDRDRGQLLEEVTGEVDELLVRWETDDRRLVRHQRELLPLATDLAEQVLVGMEVGERSASDFLLALQQEIDLEAAIIDLRADQLQRLMELQRITGGQLGADEQWAYPEVYGGQR